MTVLTELSEYRAEHNFNTLHHSNGVEAKPASSGPSLQQLIDATPDKSSNTVSAINVNGSQNPVSVTADSAVSDSKLSPGEPSLDNTPPPSDASSLSEFAPSTIKVAELTPAQRAADANWLSGLSDERKAYWQQRTEEIGVDLAQYPSIANPKTYREIVSRQNRSINFPLMRSYSAMAFKKVPDPMMLTHILTTKCNYTCSFCSFADSLNVKTNELSLQEIEEVYNTIGNNVNVIVYSGGETTLNKNLPAIIEAAYRRTSVKSVYIISNAWKPNLLFDITNQVMQRCPGLHLTWSLSIEGPREYNNIERKTKAEGWDAWQNTIETMEGLKLLREKYGYNELDVQLCSVCTPGNYQILDDWYQTIRDTLKPDKWNLNLMRRSVQMADHQMASFEQRRLHGGLEPFEQKYVEITERVRKDVLSGKLKFLYHTKNPMDGALKSAVDLISQEQNRSTVLQRPDSFKCQAGFTGGYIGSEGQVSGCEEFAHNPISNKTYGNLRDHDLDFQAVWRSKQADEFRKKTGKSNECVGCTLESQRNYPSILVSFKTLSGAFPLAKQIAKQI